MFVTQDPVHPLVVLLLYLHATICVSICLLSVVWFLGSEFVGHPVACLLVYPSISFRVSGVFKPASFQSPSVSSLCSGVSHLMDWLIYQLSLQITLILSAGN